MWSLRARRTITLYYQTQASLLGTGSESFLVFDSQSLWVVRCFIVDPERVVCLGRTRATRKVLRAGRACQMACMPDNMHARSLEHRYVGADMASTQVRALIRHGCLLLPHQIKITRGLLADAYWYSAGS